MEHQDQIDSLIAHLRDEKLRTSSAECRWERQSAALVVRATFANETTFNVHIHDKAVAKIVSDLFQENLKARFAIESEYRDILQLQIGHRYTVLVNSDMGLGIVSTQFVLEKIQVGRYAQYDHCIELIIKRKRERTLRVIQFYGKKAFALFEGWIDVDTNPFGPEIDEGPVTVKRSKYLSFDDRYMTDAIAAAGVKPLYEKLFPMQRPERSSL